MKKRTEFKLPKISADTIAKQMKRALGLDKAKSVAKYYNDTVGFHGKTNDPLIKMDDVNDAFISRKDILKNAHVWRQVHSILASQKGYTLFELVFCLAILGIVCLFIAEIGVIAHFVSKFW
jgi:prepilin-type N-terminal cleavage/methylation domain-containing protein